MFLPLLIPAIYVAYTSQFCNWNLFQFALHVYSGLVEVGKKYGLRHAGYYAMRSLRIEKFYAFWGQDLDTSTTPLECGRSFRVKFDVRSNLFLPKIVL